MQLVLEIGVVLLSYLIGSIPFGLLIVRLSTGKDIRSIESGRTGGTNAMRAAGFWAGLSTAILDMLKATFAVFLARWVAPANPWIHVLAPAAVVLGHNYSLFLMERNESGKLRLRGGAGGAPAAGGALGLWWPSILIIVPVAALVFFVIGYASLATISAGVMSIIIFGYLAAQGLVPWQYVLYGVMILFLLLIALRPNIARLLNGTERLVGLRARKRAKS